jgi:hypothetical protein
VMGEDTISRTDLIRRRWLDNDFYGFTGYIAGDQAIYENFLYPQAGTNFLLGVSIRF